MPYIETHFMVLEFHNVHGDGDCFYTSLAEALNFAKFGYMACNEEEEEDEEDTTDNNTTTHNNTTIRISSTRATQGTRRTSRRTRTTRPSNTITLTAPCIRRFVAMLIRVSPKTHFLIKNLMSLLSSSASILSDYRYTVIHELMKERLAALAAPTLQNRYADLVESTSDKRWACEIEFTAVKRWLKKLDIDLVNVTPHMKPSDILKLLEKKKHTYVLMLSSDDVHYNWVTVTYRTGTDDHVNKTIVDREIMIKLLQASIDSVHWRRSTKSRRGTTTKQHTGTKRPSHPSASTGRRTRRE